MYENIVEGGEQVSLTTPPNIDIIQESIMSPASEFNVSLVMTIYVREKKIFEVIKKLNNIISFPKQIRKNNSSSSKLQLTIGISTKNWIKICKKFKVKEPNTIVEFKEKISKVSLNDLNHSFYKNNNIYPPYVNEEGEEERFKFPDTGGDLFFYIKSNSSDLSYILSKKILDEINEENIEKKVMFNGFAYGGKDLTGFIDGTRNPRHRFNILDSAIIHSDDDPNFTQQNNEINRELCDHSGGSYLLHSRFIHNLSKFHKIPPEQQSQLVGRDITIEKEGSNPRLPDTFNHVVVNDPSKLLENEQILNQTTQIFSHPKNYHVNRAYGLMTRQSWPFAFAGENGNEEGLLFISFSRNLKEIDKALDRMLGVNSSYENQVDNLLLVSKPISTNYYYCPSLIQLNFLNKSELL